MTAPLSIAYERGGFPVELLGEEEWRRAIARRHIERGTPVTRLDPGGTTQLLSAEDVPELRRIFDEIEPQETARPADPPPTEALPAIARAPDPSASPAPSRARPSYREPPPPSQRAPQAREEFQPPIKAIAGGGVALLLVVGFLVAQSPSAPVEVNSSAANGTDAILPSPASPSPTAFQSTSYDCSKASGEAERIVCRSPALAEQDRKMASLYSRALGRGGESPSDLRRGQRSWLRERRGCAAESSPESCLARLYARRIAELAEPRRDPPTLTGTALAEKQAATRPKRTESVLVAPAPDILCVLPDGAEARTSLSQCRARAGVVMSN